MVILEMWTGSLYTLAPGDIIKVLGRNLKEKDGSVKTAWSVVVKRSDDTIVYISKPFGNRVGARTTLDAIRREIMQKIGKGTPHIYIISSAFVEEEA